MLAAIAGLAAASSSDEPNRFVVAGYAPDYRLESLDLAALAHNLTDLLLFSITPTEKGEIDAGAITQMHHMRAARAKKAAPHLRVLVSMGGGGRSSAFPAAVSKWPNRERLAKALVKYVRRGKLDGADMDWEAPLGPTEVQNYAAFLKLAKQAFEQQQPPLTLTMAVHPEHAALLAPAYQHVHRVHLMAYDLPDKSGHAALPAALSAAEGLIHAGCPRQKLALGLPFYGRSLAQPARVATYAELQSMREGPEAGEDGELPPDDGLLAGFAYDGPQGVARKVEAAAALGLAGVMVWEVGQDARPAGTPGGQLLGALAEAAEASAVGWVPGREDAARLEAAAPSRDRWVLKPARQHDEL